jgi:glycosyltransferase involved in cell wall biosynthesis
MKVFFINRYSHKELVGGSEIQCWNLAKQFAKNGHKTAYVAIEGLSGKRETAGEGFPVYFMSLKGESKLSAFRNFYKLLKKEKPDICYIRIFTYLFPLLVICRFLGIKAVFNTSHINDLKYVLEKPVFSLNILKTLLSFRVFFQRVLNAWAVRFANVATINKEHAEIFRKRGINATPVYNSMEDNYAKYKKKKENTVVWVNNIKGRKRPEMFLDLAWKFKNSGWRFLMIGAMQDKSGKYNVLVAKTKEENKMFEYFGGKTPEGVNEILAGAKIFVNTCMPEGFGNNFIQAWFSECPTLTFDFDPDGIIEREKIGFCAFGDFDKMVKNLDFLMKDENKRNEMGKLARNYALRNHSLESQAKKYEDYFKELANNP